MKIKFGDLKMMIREEFSIISEAAACDECGMAMEQCACEGGGVPGSSVDEVAPPGREKQVKSLKKVPGIDNPWAIAWSQHKKHGKPSKKGK